MPRKTKAQEQSNHPRRDEANDSDTLVIFYVGKGGVGKTTLAAATAVRAAELGHRTLVVSTDIAHSLGDILGVELGAEPIPIASNLYAQKINVLEEMRSSWGKVQDLEPGQNPKKRSEPAAALGPEFPSISIARLLS
jgi:anion-transporting  ArsA/GET3 family ATPase